MLFAPNHLVSLFTLGLPSALVLDCGYSETLVLPVSLQMKLLWAGTLLIRLTCITKISVDKKKCDRNQVDNFLHSI